MVSDIKSCGGTLGCLAVIRVTAASHAVRGKSARVLATVENLQSLFLVSAHPG